MSLKLTLYTKDKCHLCDVMKETISRLSGEYNLEFEEIDITSSGELFEMYKLKIPVLMVNGKMFAKFRLDEDKLRRKLIG